MFDMPAIHRVDGEEAPDHNRVPEHVGGAAVADLVGPCGAKVKPRSVRENSLIISNGPQVPVVPSR